MTGLKLFLFIFILGPPIILAVIGALWFFGMMLALLLGMPFAVF